MIALSSIKVTRASMERQLIAGDATYFNFTQDNNSAFNASGASASTGMQYPTVTNDLRIKLNNGSFLETFDNFNNLTATDCSNIFNQYNKIRISYNIYTGTGNDGNVTISGTKNINTDTISSNRSRPDAINFNVINLTATTAKLSTTPVAGDLTVGDEVLLINLQGTSSNHINVGNYETLMIKSISGDTITFTTAKTKYYGSGSSDDLNLGTTTSTQRVMLQRIPQYNNVTIDVGNTLTANAWNGTKGGVLFFRVAGTLTLYGTITMSGKGYRGGASRSNGNAVKGYQGEGCSGNYNTGTAQTDNYGGGGGGQAEVFNYGGSGGAGGGYGATGSSGGGYNAPTGGSSYGINTLTSLFFGGGGGSGAIGYNNYGSVAQSSGAGGIGGGIISINANNVILAGTITTDGGAGGGASGQCSSGMSAGGGGAGGSLLLRIINITVGTHTVTANLGLGSTVVFTGGFTGSDGGVGGNGSVGRIALFYKIIDGTISSTPTKYNLQTVPVNNNNRIVSSKVLDGHTVTNIRNLNYRLERKPYNTEVKIQFSQDKTNQYDAHGTQNQYSILTTDTTVLSLSDLSAWSGNNFYYRIDMSSDGNDSPILDWLEIDYDPDVYESTEQSQQSHVIDSVVGARVKTLYCEWELDQTDRINPKIQLFASSTGSFTGEETVFPAGPGTFYQHGNIYSLDNSSTLDIQSFVGYNFYRYQKIKLYLDAGTILADSPKIKTLSMTGVLKTTAKAEQIGDSTSSISNVITKNTSVKIAEKSVSISSPQRTMILAEVQLDNTGYDSPIGTKTSIWISRDGTQLHEKLTSSHLYQFQYQKTVIDVPPVGEVKYQIYASEDSNKCNSNVIKCNLRVITL